MNYKIKNILIDSTYPLFFWGSIYLFVVLSGYWTFQEYLKWYCVMILFTPLKALSGRVVNRWRTLLKYEYKGYT